MPPKRSVPGSGSGAVRATGANTSANPTTSAPTPPPTEVISSTVDKSPSPTARPVVLPENTDVGIDVDVDMDLDGKHDFDHPGPSSQFIPPSSRPRSRSLTPPLPDLRHRPFPPDVESDDEDDSSSSISEDEVVQRLPVYLSTQLKNHLHLFQYPLHTISRPLAVPQWAADRGKEMSARVKEDVGRIEVEVPVDMGQQVWRQDEADNMGFKAGNGRDDGIEGGVGYERAGGGGGGGGGQGRRKKEMWGENVRLRSEVLPSHTGYYTGVVLDGALHLHPVTKVQQFRTSLQYLDDRDARRKDRSGGGDDDEAAAAEAAGKKKAGGPIVPAVKPRKGEEQNDGSGSIMDFRNKLKSVHAAETGDKWVKYKWADIHHDSVAESYDKLVLSEDKRVRLKTTTRPLDYIDKVQ